MAISEQARHQMYSRLEAVLGADEAATLMEHLPPVGWADVATKRDLDALAGELRGEMRTGFAEVRTEMAELGAELRVEMAELRSDVAELGGELRAEMSELRGEVRGEIGNLRGEIGNLRGEIGNLRGEVGDLRGEFHSQLRTNLVASVTANAAVVGIAAGLARLF